MTTYLPSQMAFTDMAVAQVKSVTEPEVLVGDGVAPDAGGWAMGQVNITAFVPYVVVAVSTLIGGADGALADLYGDAAFVVSLRSYGGSRAQADLAADLGRRSLADLMLTNVVLGDSGTWRVLSVTYPGLGGPTRIDTVDPPYWSVIDSARIALHRTVRP